MEKKKLRNLPSISSMADIMEMHNILSKNENENEMAEVPLLQSQRSKLSHIETPN